MTTISKNKTTFVLWTLGILCALVPSLAHAQVNGQNGQNYIYSKTFMDENGNSCIEEIAYFNGIGQPVQTVKKGITPSGNDLVTLRQYDRLGRDSVYWLPIPVANNNGEYMAPSSIRNAATNVSAYDSDTAPYSTILYDSSPLSRVVRETSAGQAWYDNEKCVSTEYYANDEGIFSCRRFNVSGNGYVVTSAGLWPSGALTVTKTSDEDGRIQVVFKDFLNRIVLKRSVYENGNNDTYFIYDQRGNLQAVLPPAAVKLLENNAAAEEVSKYAYFYEYDLRGNCTSKKLPGAAPVEYRYDRSGRVIFSQDGNLRADNKWHFYLYDSFGRQVVHGITRMNTPPDMGNQTVCAQYGSGTDTFGGYSANLNLSNISLLSVNYYDNYSFLDNERNAFRDFVANGNQVQGTVPANATGMLTGSRTYVPESTKYQAAVLYYDEKGRLIRSCSENNMGGYDENNAQYTFTGLPQEEIHYHTVQGKPAVTTEYSHTYDHAGRLLTTTYTLNGGTPVTLAANSYDELGRLQSVERADNPMLTTQYAYNLRSWTTEISSLHFSQQLFYNQSHHGSTPQWGGNVSAMDWTAPNIPTGLAMQPTAPTCKLMGYAFSYDNLSRLTQADYYENNDRSNHYDTRYSYDMMGNIVVLERNGLHDDGEFGLIDYLTFDYEGNQVTKVTDEVSDGPYRKDAWHYRDGSNRETEREYDENGNLVKDSDAKISSIQYNLLNLPRMIKFSDGGKHIYTYDASGRKLRAEHHVPVVVAAEPQIPMEEPEIAIDDEPQVPINDDEPQVPIEAPQMVEEMVALEWEMAWEEFEEWVAEELIPMEEEPEFPEQPMEPEEIVCILPPQPDDQIIIDQPIWEDQPIEYDVPCDITTIDYCGNYIYEDGKLKRILIPGGYVTFTSNNINLPEYHFYITDHQGNIRVVANQNGEVEQMNHYYPYGGLMGESTGSDAQPYKYNGKELDRHSGLDWYDYGARWYDGMRFNTMDRFAEKYPDLSPYSYCAGNPINAIDINGDSIYFDMPTVEKGEIISYTRYTYGKYGNNYGFGRNGELYHGSNTTINAISEALNKLSSGGSYGNYLVSSLAGNTGIDVIVGHGYNETRHTTGSSYVMVKWNREDDSGGLDINGSTYIEPFINLGHELIHAQNFIENTINRNPWFTTPTGTITTYEEHVACVRENILRAENGFPLRKYYALYEGTQRP